MKCSCSRPRGVCVCSWARILVAALVAFSLSCSGVQPSGDGGVVTPVSWVSTAQTSLAVLDVALPGAIAVVQALPVDPNAKLAAVEALTTAQDALPGVQSALTNYRNNPSTANMCIARAAVQLVASSLLAVGDALAQVGFDVPGAIVMALGGLGSLVDELMPVCVVDAGAPLSSTIADHLAARPGSLRPFPPLPRSPR